jgi:hypothetical protein
MPMPVPRFNEQAKLRQTLYRLIADSGVIVCYAVCRLRGSRQLYDVPEQVFQPDPRE